MVVHCFPSILTFMFDYNIMILWPVKATVKLDFKNLNGFEFVIECPHVKYFLTNPVKLLVYKTLL